MNTKASIQTDQVSANPPVLDEIFKFFSSDPLGPRLSLGHIVDDETHPLKDKLNEQLSLFQQDHLAQVQRDDYFRAFGGRIKGGSWDRKARVFALEQLLVTEIPKVRLEVLKRHIPSLRPPPYDHPALADLEVPSDHLVPLTAFQVEGSTLIRNGFAFTVVPPVESTNSQYWLLQALLREGLRDVTFVRLDPLLVRSKEEYSRFGYKMWWYGQSLDWERLARLKEEEHGRWLPDNLSVSAAFTDFVWSPRNSEVHFQCEELPQFEDLVTRGSRYFHAVYHPEHERIIHLDGAIRVYNEAEWQPRCTAHVRNAGKVGTRIKVFRVDAPVSKDAFSNICPNYFVWNNDVARYFGVDIPDSR